MISIIADELIVRYERQVALDIKSLTVSGTVIAVLGHNGAGKSTLLKTLLGLLAPQRGTLIAKTSQNLQLVADQHMAFCPENGAVFEDISVSDYLRIWLRLKSKDASLTNPSVTKLLDLFEVDPLLPKFGRELSKGQRRRVQSVVGFLIEPKLFLFDEPFDGLDVQRTAELASILELYKDQTAFIISSHRMDVIERVADAGIVLANGKMIAQGGMAELSIQLAGRSFLLHQALIKEKILLKELAQHFSLYFTQIGDQIVLTGPSATEIKLQEFLKIRGISELKGREVAPTLTDAMGYHLQGMRLGKPLQLS